MHILVVEDNHRVSELITRGLEEQQYTVTQAYDAVFGKKLAMSGDFSLIIIDIILPGMNGLELSKEIRSFNPVIPIIMLTALGATDDKIDGFNAGADDYMVKPFEMRELIVRIRTLINRKHLQNGQHTGSCLKFADLEIDRLTKTVKRNDIEIDLTPKEFKLLEYMMENPERILSRVEISEHVWDTHFDTGTNYIDVYINYIRKKVDKDFGDKLIHTKSGMGFMLKQKA
ncbi:response regulator transcription factor [Pedobacter antarcticus]|uniref:response regulator transcription factor n=1 Tax=Pedobacter antarcticus TaxID=34086 RepID=UPI00292EE2E9|nr:response regulator transcription factor [Pedobacter antarcticus]